jgi:hypothetical protein
MSIDLARGRIALSMKSRPEGGAAPAAPRPSREAPREPRQARPVPAPAFVPKAGSVAPNGMRFK